MTLPPPVPGRSGKFRHLDESECWQLLETTTVCRLGFATDDGIMIVPVNFLVFDRRIFVHTTPTSIVAVLAEGREDVAFEVDHHDDLSQSGWNVLVKASSAEVTGDEAGRAIASTHRLGPWAPGDRSLVIALTPRELTGRRVSLR